MASTDRPRKRNRVENARRTRQALLKAALSVVARHGYKKSSVSRITQAAGVAQGTLYSYFDTHNQLLAELVPSETTSLIEALRSATEGAADYFDHERRVFMAFAEYLRKSPYLLRVLTELEIAAPESHARYLRAIEALQLTALQAAKAKRRGQVRERAGLLGHRGGPRRCAKPHRDWPVGPRSAASSSSTSLPRRSRPMSSSSATASAAACRSA